MIWQRKRSANAVFVHIPKTAGGSIRMFCKKAGIKVIGHDLRDPDYRWFSEEKELQQHFSFTIVRHPVARCLSAFHFLSQGGINEGDKEDAERFVLPYNGDFGAFVKNELAKGDVLQQIHFIPQNSWVSDNGRLLVDAVFRFEQMPQVEKKLQELFHLPFDFPIRNASKGAELQLDHLAPIIAECYQHDMRLFQYEL